MAAEQEKSADFYAVLGLKKECSAAELRKAYKKLALRWHPDRCSASGNSKFVEESKQKFQAIQEAYSDANKRFLYDVGAYNSDDDENEMGDFLGEMAMMMSQTKRNGNGEESFEELQDLFEEMFQQDVGAFGSFSCSSTSNLQRQPPKESPCASNVSTKNNSGSNSCNNKRNSSDMSSGKAQSDGKAASFEFSCMEGGHTFCTGRVGGEESRGRSRSGRRKQKVSSSSSSSSTSLRDHVSAQGAKISV